jgi:hypothetical protein
MTRSEELGKDAIEDLKLAGDAEEGGIAGASGVDGAFDGFEAEGVVADLRLMRQDRGSVDEGASCGERCEGGERGGTGKGWRGASRERGRRRRGSASVTRKKSEAPTHLPQLHNLILQPLDARRLLLPLARSQLGKDHPMLLDLPRQLELQTRHPTLDDPLDLVGQIALDILLQATEKEGTQDLVQTTDDEERFFFVDLDLVLSSRVGEGGVKPFVEGFDRAEDFGEDEVEKGPELGEVVLVVVHGG